MFVWIYDTWHVHFHVNIFFKRIDSEEFFSECCRLRYLFLKCTHFCNIWSICHKCCHHPAKITSQPTNQPTNQKKVKRFIFGQLNEMFIMIFLNAARTYTLFTQRISCCFKTIASNWLLAHKPSIFPLVTRECKKMLKWVDLF